MDQHNQHQETKKEKSDREDDEAAEAKEAKERAAAEAKERADQEAKERSVNSSRKPVVPKPVVVDVTKHIALHHGGDHYEVIDAPVDLKGNPEPRNRTIEHEGVMYEHTGDYKGVWAYRHLG